MCDSKEVHIYFCRSLVEYDTDAYSIGGVSMRSIVALSEEFENIRVNI